MIENSSLYSALNNQKFHKAYTEFIVDQNYTHCLTLQWVQRPGYTKLMNDLRRLNMIWDRKLLGRTYNKSDIRTPAMYFVEGQPYVDMHVHILLRLPESHWEKFEALFPENQKKGVWKRIAPKGTYNLQRNNTAWDAAAYCTKDNHIWSDDVRRLFLSDDLISSSSSVAR